MKKIPTISDAEWEVMNVIWDKLPMTSNEVVERLSKTKDWNHRTIKTMLNRLMKKGALTFEHHGRSYLYSARVSRAACVRNESKSFVERVFDGAPVPMLVDFVRNTDLSPEDINELKQILKEKEK